MACLTAEPRLRAQTAPQTTPETEIATAPVTLDGITLFSVRGVSSLPAGARAGLISERIRSVAANPAIAAESIRTADSGEFTRIVAGDVTLMGVLEADANIEQISRATLADVHVDQIRRAVLAYRAARSPEALRRGVINAVLATVMLVAIIVAVIVFFRWIDRALDRRLHAKIQSVQIQSLELIRGERIRSVLRSVLVAWRTIVVLAVALLYIGYVLAQFPWTRGLSQNMTSLALGPLKVMAGGFVARIPSLVFLVVLYFVVRVILRLIRMFFDAVGDGTVKLARFDQDWADPTYKIVRLAVIAFALVVAYPYIPGSGSAAFSGISVFIGVLFSLGSSSAISNIIAGYMLRYRRALKVGERVKIGDAFGDVIDTGLQATHLRSVKNEEITIANSEVLSTEIINYSSLARTEGLILHTEVGIGYDTPWRQVEAMLLAAAERTPGLSKERRPFVRQKHLGDFAVTYEVNGYCHDAQAMHQIYTDLHRNILDVFNEHGIQIMTPAYEGDPEQPKIVPQKDWYTSPASPPTTSASPDRELTKAAAAPGPAVRN
jgi:small-conductance mechanosensitive channel